MADIMGLVNREITDTESKQNKPRVWPALTVTGVFVYIAIDIVLTFLRPDYSWVHNAESDYGRGPYFWLMDSNFILRGLFSLALVKVLLAAFPKSKPAKNVCGLLAVWAVASGLLAFFTDNPYGYAKLRSGGFHIIIAFIAFIAALVAMIAFRRLTPVMKLSETIAYSSTALTGVAFVSLILLGHSGFHPHSLGGLYERVFLASVLAWEVVLALFVGAKGQAAADT